MWVRIHHYTFKQSTMMDLYNSYEKAIKVIDSCFTESQLGAATIYCRLFLKYSKDVGHDNQIATIYYEDLINRVHERYDEIN